MTQPSPYNRSFNFSNYQSSHPADPLPASSLDEELSRIKAVTDAIRVNLAIIQRDDTALANRSVGFDQLKTEVQIGINPPSAWATATNYVARDTVFEDSNFYICDVSHVSGTFATDLAAGKWELIASFEAATSAGSVSYDHATSGLVATTVQAAIDEVVSDVNTLSTTVSGFALVASTGDYTDLSNLPALAAVATSGAYADLSGKPTLGTAAAKDVGTAAGTVAAGDDSRITGAAQKTDLASNASGKGAATIGIEDSAGNYTGTTVETVLAEIATNLADHGIGVGQTWQDVKSSRTAGTVYQNTTGKPIQLRITFNNGAGDFLYVGPTSSPATEVGRSVASAFNQCYPIIPNNHYYKVTGSIITWEELR